MGNLRFEGIHRGGESVLVNGAVFKTGSETVRTGSGRFDSYTPPPGTLPISNWQLLIGFMSRIELCKMGDGNR